MIEIVKRGNLIGHYVIQGKCKHCSTEVEFTPSDACNFNSSQKAVQTKKVYFLYIECPLCKEHKLTNFIYGKSIKN